MLGTYSHRLSRLPGVQALLGEPVHHIPASKLPDRNIRALVGWGMRPSTQRPRRIAAELGVPFISVEDGFLRSFGIGPEYPTLSMVVDEQGIYYAADRPSSLETLLASDTELLSGEGAHHAVAMARFLKEGYSKYNLAPDLDGLPGDAGRPRVLIVDQTLGDASIKHGLADATTFMQMFETARRTHPDAVLYVKTHPAVNLGAKQGYLSQIQEDARCILLRHPISPASLLAEIDHVYVVTSQIGFEALLRNIPVTCFGMPWYAGWGATIDKHQVPRRQKTRTVAELFAAAYLHYTRYLDPTTGDRGSIFAVMDWISRQREMQCRHQGRNIAVGLRRWKAHNLRPFLSGAGQPTYFVPNAAKAAALQPKGEDRIYVWGAKVKPDIQTLAEGTGATLIHMEDGFIRSVGLGSDFLPPHALVMDSRGLYFDARQPSDLEALLNQHRFTDSDLARARDVRDFIVTHQLTKYNIDPLERPEWRPCKRPVLLVPGQVEDDASIQYGCDGIRDNLSLLREVRAQRPEAYLVYKPHPDVMARNRAGRLHHRQALQYADTIETKTSIVNCIDACDELHTMTSLSGFDALLRGKTVVTYGTPFYAGWGLTIDRGTIVRRDRTLTLEELIAGALLHYPVYWDWDLKGYTTCEATLRRLARVRDDLMEHNKLHTVRKNYWQRQWRKFTLWIQAGFTITR